MGGRELGSVYGVIVDSAAVARSPKAASPIYHVLRCCKSMTKTVLKKQIEKGSH